jgi:hypothetical protein
MMNDICLAICSPEYESRTIAIAATRGPAEPSPHTKRPRNISPSDGANTLTTAPTT